MEIVTENPTSLAWLGDALFSLRIREHLLAKGIQNPARLQRLSSSYCSAKGQAAILQKMEAQNMLDEDEKEIVRRGRNAHVQSIAKNADKATYMQATALEALLGYHRRYGHEQRLEELLDLCVELGEDQ